MWKVVWRFVCRNWKWVMMGLLVVALLASMTYSRNMRLRWLREKGNTEALTMKYRLSETKRGEAVTTIQELQYTVDEFKKRQADDAATIKELKIRASEVREVVKTVVETKIVYKDTVILMRPDSILHWNRDTKWWSVQQTIDLAKNPPITEFNLHTRDSLTHYLYCVPKCRFLGLHFGAKRYEIKVVNHNPNSTISYARWISVSKDKQKRYRE
nr:MAG TPA: hypothetical protein [Herelleviridae sp.]